MTATPFQGPLIVFRGNDLGPFGTGSANQNPEAAPSPIEMGVGLLDTRAPFTYHPGSDFGAATYMFLGGRYQCIDAIPSAIADNNIAASQSPGAGAIALVSTSGAGITVATTITRADTGATVTGLLAIDTAMAGVAYGQAGTFNTWDTTKAIARNIRITSGSDDTGITFTVTGYDLYGYPMSEAITGVNNAVASGVKAFKYITSVTHTGSVAGTVKVGTGDVIGLPIRVDRFAYANIVYNNTVITASTGFVAAVTTSPATTTTGDVRGTYALQAASDGTKRLQVFIAPSVANVNSITGVFGVVQNLATNNG